MKKFLITAVFAIIGALAFSQELLIVIAPFEVRAGFSGSDAETIEYLLLNELSKFKAIKVLDQSDAMFRETMRRMDFELSDWSNSNKVAEFGRALNANAVVLGRVMKLGDELIIAVRINDLNTEIKAANDMVVTNVSEVRGRLPAFTAEIVERLPKLPAPVKRGYDIGDIGPGEGTVFLKEGNKHMEYIELPGQYTWEEAKTAVNRYRGGGYSNWRLPSLNEARFIGNLSYTPYGYFWSSEEAPRERGKAMAKLYWFEYSRMERMNYDRKDDNYVIAIRTFYFTY
jgi:TolB-like protein